MIEAPKGPRGEDSCGMMSVGRDSPSLSGEEVWKPYKKI